MRCDSMTGRLPCRKASGFAAQAGERQS